MTPAPNSGVSHAQGAPRGGVRCPRWGRTSGCATPASARGAAHHPGLRHPTTGPEVGTHPGRHRHPRLGPRGRSPRAAPPCEPPAPRDNAALPEGRPSPPLPGVVGRNAPGALAPHTNSMSNNHKNNTWIDTVRCAAPIGTHHIWREIWLDRLRISRG